jgi:hypothetical protein
MDCLKNFIKTAYDDLNIDDCNNINVYYCNNIKLLHSKDFGCGTIISNNKMINFIKTKLTKLGSKKVKQYQYNNLSRIIDDNNTKKTFITEILKYYYIENIFVNISRETLIHENNFPIINSYNCVSDQLIELYAGDNIECYIIYENNITHIQIKMTNSKANIILFIQELFSQ